MAQVTRLGLGGFARPVYPGFSAAAVRPDAFQAPNVPEVWRDLGDWSRRVARAVNGILDGRINAFGSVTLTASATFTNVTDARVGVYSVILLMPTSASAAAEQAAGGMYVSNRGNETFTIIHANNAQTDRTFDYVALG